MFGNSSIECGRNEASPVANRNGFQTRRRMVLRLTIHESAR